MPLSRIALAAAAALIAGCALGPAYERPEAELPAQWRETPPRGVQAPAKRWWTMFGDPALDRLVEEALASNQDLALATARVDEARALSDIADSQRMPTVDATFERDRFHFSERAPVPIPSNAVESNSYRAKLNVAYEVDLWGRLRSASRAARAELLASEANRETVRIALATEVVRAYFALVALDAQVQATRRSLALRAEGLDRLMQAIVDIHGIWNRRVPTAGLNKWLEAAVGAHPPPAVSGRRLKLNYMTQPKARPHRLRSMSWPRYPGSTGP